MDAANTMQALSARVIAALTADTTSTAVQALTGEVAAELAALTARRVEVEAISIDPLTPADQADAAATQAGRIALDVRRLQTAAQRLDERLTEVRDEERRREAAAAQAAASLQRDIAAKNLRVRYTKLANELADLMQQLVDSDAAVQAAGAWPTAEQQARGVDPQGRAGANQCGTLPQRVYLPAFDPFEQSMSWPIWGHGRRGGTGGR